MTECATEAEAQVPATEIGFSGPEDIALDYDELVLPRRALGFWTRYYQLVFRRLGISYGRGLRVLGPLLLQVDGGRGSIRLGTNVTLMPRVHLKTRETGHIILHDRTTLDTGVRLVAANDARIEIGEFSSIGIGSVINAGRDVIIGRGTITAGYCYLNVSDHRFAAGIPIRSQGFIHRPIYVGEDAWLGAHCFVLRGAVIGNGAIIAAHSFVRGEIPAGAICEGRPAVVRQYRR